MFAGEQTGLEVFEGVFDGFGMYETSKKPMWAMNPVNVEGELFLCFFKQGTGADDVVMGLKSGWVVGGVTARAEEEGGWFVLVLPDTAFEVLSCGTMISAHLSEARHKASLNRLEPLRWAKSEKSRSLAGTRKGEEPAFWAEDTFVVVFEVVEELVPFSERLCLYVG